MKIPTINSLRKALSIAFYGGPTLEGRGYQGSGNSFFSDLSYGSSDAGIAVNNDVALNYTAYWSCVRLLSETLASLPCVLYEKLDTKGKNKATEHSLFRLLHDEPNPEMDSFSYFETLMYHLVSANGNCYSYIDWNNDLTIKYLWIMNPDRTQKARDDNGEIVFKYQTEKAGQIILPAYRVWHIPGFGYDGLKGYTPLTYMRNQIGLGVAAEKMGSKLFSNGLTIGGVLEHPGKMSIEAQNKFKASIEKGYQGVEKAHRLLVLEEGMKYNKTNIQPDDAQWLETRKFQRNEIASFFRVPPHMIGDLERATFSNIEHQGIEFAMYTMRPWLVRWERAANRQLLLPTEKDNYFIKFTIDALLRGDTLTRYQAYSSAINWGWMNRNE
ncbi:MAG: phage portal protein, partial [Candidatus Omnitrophica bacterium]|nr:phage portal protein [Candidatus Omnitrophota bacterium]